MLDFANSFFKVWLWEYFIFWFPVAIWLAFTWYVRRVSPLSVLALAAVLGLMGAMKYYACYIEHGPDILP